MTKKEKLLTAIAMLDDSGYEYKLKILSGETRKEYKKCNHSWVELKSPVLAWKCKKCGQIKC